VKGSISIIVVDDHAVVRNGLRAYLATQTGFEVVGEATTGEEAIRLVSQFIPDVVLMDLILPGITGVEATHRIKKISPRTHIVVLTSSTDDSLIFSAFKAGADAYILKDMKMDNLTVAIQRTVHGEVTLLPRIAALILTNWQTFGDEDDSSPFTLSELEVNVLNLTAKGFSNRKISDELSITESKVNGHLNNILIKLHLAGRTLTAVDTPNK